MCNVVYNYKFKCSKCNFAYTRKKRNIIICLMELHYNRYSAVMERTLSNKGHWFIYIIRLSSWYCLYCVMHNDTFCSIHAAVCTIFSLSFLSICLFTTHSLGPAFSLSLKMLFCFCFSVSLPLSLSLPILSKKSVSLPLTHLVLPSFSLRLCLFFIRFCVFLSLLLCPSLTFSLSKILFINMINVSSYLVGTHFVFIYYCIKRYTFCIQECSLIPP